jgi:hypothetical protein
MEEIDNIGFVATNDDYYFPHHDGNDTYRILAHDYEKLQYDEEYHFQSNVKVFIPNHYVGHIYINPEYKSLITINERFLEGNKWHNIEFTVKYIDTCSSKIYGSRGLAFLTISKCE